MEDDGVVDGAGLFQILDLLAPGIATRISARHHHHANTVLGFPRNHIFGKVAVDHSVDGREHVALPAGENRLRFGIAEAAVELHHARLAVVDHQPGVEHALVDDAALLELGERAAIDLGLYLFKHFGRNDRGGGVGAHAAGVRPLVVFEDALVVLRRRKQHHVVAVDQRQDGGLFAREEILDHHACAGLAKSVAFESIADGGFGLLDGFGHGHTLARRQPVGLDHDRRTAFADIFAGGIGIGEGFVGRGRHTRRLHDFLGKLLATLQFGGGPVRPEHAEALGLQQIRHARAERRLRADHH